MLICAMAGLVMYARYYDCDPIMTKKVSSPDQVSAFNKNTTKRQAATFSYKHCHRSTIHKPKAILSTESYVGLSYRHANRLQSKQLALNAFIYYHHQVFSERQSTSVSTDICLRSIQLNRHALCVVYSDFYFPSVTVDFYTLVNCFTGVPLNTKC